MSASHAVPHDNTTPYWVTVNQAAKITKVHANTIRNWIARGLLPAHRMGERLVRINKSDLDALATPIVGGE
jgi:excisionase family DNA binding protein